MAHDEGVPSERQVHRARRDALVAGSLSKTTSDPAGATVTWNEDVARSGRLRRCRLLRGGPAWRGPIRGRCVVIRRWRCGRRGRRSRGRSGSRCRSCRRRRSRRRLGRGRLGRSGRYRRRRDRGTVRRRNRRRLVRLLIYEERPAATTAALSAASAILRPVWLGGRCGRRVPEPARS